MKERNAFFSNVGLCMKLALVTLLMIGGSNFAWGDELTVNDETGNSTRIPFQGTYVSTSYYSANAQFIYPSSVLEDMNGKSITKLTFYGGSLSDEYASWGDAQFKVYMTEVDKTAFATAAFDSWAPMSEVYSGKVYANGRKMEIELASPFEYKGGNLLIGFYRTQTGIAKAYTWYGKSQSTNTAVYQAYSKDTEKVSQEKFLPKITFSYFKNGTPSSFYVSNLTSGSATLNWTANGTEEKWQIAYSTDRNFNPNNVTPVNVTSRSYTLNGLIDGVTYYVYVRSDYENETYSDWYGKLEFIPQNRIVLNDDTGTSTFSPVHNYTKYGVKSQYVINADNLFDIRNSIIEGVVFYAKEYFLEWPNATFDVYVSETDTYSTFDNYSVSFKDWGTKVCSDINFTVRAGELTIIFDTPFKYTNGNLMIGIQQTSGMTSSNITSTWYGHTESTDYTSAYYASTSSSSDASFSTSRAKFSPKMSIWSVSPTIPATIGSTGYTTFSNINMKALDLDDLPDGLKAYYVASDAIGEGKVKLTAATGKVSAGTGLILKGTAGDTYQIPVAESGDAISGNLLVGCTTSTVLTANANYYVLVNNGGTPEFQSLEDNGATIPGGKAYLSVPGAARSLQIVIDDGQTTGISDALHLMDNGKMRNNIFFNLNGQRVAQPTKGLYIKNGKKVVMK